MARRIYYFGSGHQDFELERTEPARPASLESDVLVPFFQSLITGVMVGVLGVLVAIWLGWNWWAWGVGSFVVVSLLGWVFLLGEHRDLLKKVEVVKPVFNANAGGDAVRVELVEKDEGGVRSMRFVDLFLGRDRVAVAKRLLEGETGKRSLRGLMSESEIERMREELFKAGLARWRFGGPARGWELTAAGRAVMRRVLEEEEEGG